MGWVNERDALSRRRVKVADNCDHQTSRWAAQISASTVVSPNSARDSANRMVRSSHGLEIQMSKGGSHGATLTVVQNTRNRGNATAR